MPFDPFSQLAGQAIKVGTDIWTAIMLSVWNVGLLLMRFVLRLEEHFLTPDLTESGPARDVYATTFWIAASLLVIMIMVQLGVAALRRDGKSLGRLLLGVGQFVVVWAAWLTYAAAVIAACSGLNAALMRTLFATDSLAGWDPLGGFEVGDVTEVVTAGVLGLLGVLLCVAAIAHFVVLLTRAGALVVLAATTPISAAGLVGDTGRAWFWKSLRWFHAAAFTPVVMTLVMGVGVQMASGVAGGQADKTNEAIGTALPAVVLMLISAVSPLALFKLLAFVDPGTNSGASLRMSLGALGGMSGLLGGQRGAGDAGTATQTAASGRSQGEAQGEDATSRRFAAGQAGQAGSAGGAGTASAGAGTASAGAGAGLAGAAAGVAGVAGVAGMALAAGVRGLASVGGSAAAVASDTTNQMGVGHNTYQPDFSGTGHRGSQNSQSAGADPGGQPATDQPGAPDG
ncbi:MAG: hypothetical protein VB093_17975, partial [Propionicimonas sp.]|nr:hypothetical protein [Propionicimonas sp.]